MSSDLLLIFRTAIRRYAARRGDVQDIKLMSRIDLQAADEHGKPYLGVELGRMFDPSDCSLLARRCALIVPMRRRRVALLVDRVDSFEESIRPIPLPPLLATRLCQPWAVGALVLENEVIVELDLRAIARSALVARPGEG